jgi:large subunit ribosomal protein L19
MNEITENANQKLNKGEILKVFENRNMKEKDIKIPPIQTGDILRIGYKIPEGDKERIQFYEGLVIAKQNRSLSQTFTLRRNVQGVGVEQIFLVHSPKIVSIVKKQASKVRRAKLYFMRSLQGKATRLKVKR